MFRFAQHDSAICRIGLLRFLSDSENDFAACVTSRDLLLGFHRFGKWERLRDDYLDFLFVDQLADLSELT